ncbi:MAG TPA: Gfo/Idh/MocA family oxidoreductase, partial [Candidatus Acidoferrales bacterium]|nr:Gfo/Idh/MocA family oxidoreductase [Candidatus Acidoferrales bacterium]
DHIAVAVVGCGYWGKNLVRNFHQLGRLRVICDVDRAQLEKLQQQYEGVDISTSYEDVLRRQDIEGIVIAAPAEQHYSLAKRALEMGKDVFVEKPLALNVLHAEELTAMAHRSGNVLMVGHLLQYHPAITKLKSLVREGALGKVQYIYSSRLNFGKLRTEENILWSFAPHDISAILFLLGEEPTSVAAHGGNYLNANVADVTLTSCTFASGATAHIFVSWLHPFKEQKLVVVGDRQMAVFDDMQTERKLVLYSHRIEWLDRHPIAKQSEGQVVQLPAQEPLRLECLHFLECISTRQAPNTDGNNGVRVLRILNASERSLKSHGEVQSVSGTKPSYYVDPTARVDLPTKIGNGSHIWHFSHVMPNCEIGENCNMGQNVHVASGVRIGNNVKIQNNVSLYTGVELEDDVFCGPSMVFTNVTNPRSFVNRKNEYKKTLVRRGASLGANSTIVCGVTIGEYAFIGAGAVVTRDVAPFALMVGSPARRIGWMCKCGARLEPKEGQARCVSCGLNYSVDSNEIKLAEVPTAASQELEEKLVAPQRAALLPSAT